MIHDSGYAEIYSVVRDETIIPPSSADLAPKSAQTFGELTVGATRFYAAAGVGQQIDRMIEIWRDDTITTRDLCKISGRMYLIRQVTYAVDSDGIDVTRLSLEASDNNVWEGSV